ncbi:MAG: acetyltransferase [Bacillaceae bacterium]
MKDLIIIGAGGVGRETALIVEQINHVKQQWNVLGFIDDNPAIQGEMVNDYPILGTFDELLQYEKEAYVVCAISNYAVKKKMVEKITATKSNLSFATLIHPSVECNKFIVIGKGCIIYPNVVATTNITIGDHVIVSPKVGIGHDTVIEDYCTLLWNVNISGNVRLREGTFIGSGATVLQNLEVGKGAIIGAQAIALKSVKENQIVAGVPAREISKVKQP